MFFRPPSRTPSNKNYNLNFYNLTMTYSLDADILFGYGGVDDLSSGKRISPARNIEWKKPNENFTGSSQHETKAAVNVFT